MVDDEMLKCLEDQNPHLFKDCAQPKIVQKFKTKTANGMKLEVSGELFKKAMETRRVNIGWDTCIVHEAYDLSRCYKCCGFHHVAKNCKASLICSKCSQNHDIKDCTSETEKCINCVNVSNALKKDLGTNHSALSLLCPVYKRKIEAECRRIDYDYVPNNLQ